MTEKAFVFYSDKIEAKSDGKNFYIDGYISTGDLDLVNDVVTKSGLDGMFSQFDEKSIKLDFEHEAFRGKDLFEAERAKTRIPLGKAINRSRDEKGVKVEWQLNQNWKKFDEKGNIVMTFKDIWNNIKDGFYDAFSIAYIPTQTKTMQRQGKNVRLLDDVRLLNVALTGNPVNPAASMTSVMAKSLEYMESKEDELEKSELLEIKSLIDGLKSEIRDLKQKLECDSMEEEQKSPELDQTETSEEIVEETKSEAVEETKSEEPEQESEEVQEKSENTEVKSMFAELKSQIDNLKSELDNMKKENSELKSVVESARVKSIGQPNKAEEKEVKSENSSFKGPLDKI